MAKFFGLFGYRETGEVRNGIWMPRIVEYKYVGDVIRRSSRMQANSDSENQNVTCTNEISIVADPYAYEHYSTLVYVVWMGQKWSVKSIEVKYPRLIISLGDPYNDPSEESNEDQYDEPPELEENEIEEDLPYEPVIYPNISVGCNHVTASDKEIERVLDVTFS